MFKEAMPNKRALRPVFECLLYAQSVKFFYFELKKEKKATKDSTICIDPKSYFFKVALLHTGTKDFVC